MAVDKPALICGVAFTVVNFGGQFFFAETKEVLLNVIGCFIHLIACALLGFAMIMLFQTVLQKTATSLGRAQQGIDVDMVIAYTLFCFTGFALTFVAVFLRQGSFVWNVATVLMGLAASAAVEPSIRIKLRNRGSKLLSSEEVDTWSAGGGGGGPSPSETGMRHRY